MRISPTGDQVVLEQFGYRAVITQVGASLRSLTHNGRPLIRSFDEQELPPAYSGAVLAPWPNRIGNGRYRFGGRTLQVPINEVGRGNALHGLVYDRPWQVEERSGSEVWLTHRLWPTSGYPWLLDLAVYYGLDPTGLSIELSALNAADEDAPYGCSFHPYLVAGGGTVDAWTIQVSAAQVLTVESERLLPLELRPAGELNFDFRREASLDGLVIDHAFTGIALHGAVASLQVRAPAGTGTELRWFAGTPWLQLCTGDGPERPLHRTGLAAEPMTCPPDAFNSGTDLLHLAPGALHRTRIEIGSLGA